MTACRTLVRTSLSSLEYKLLSSNRRSIPSISLQFHPSISLSSSNLCFTSFLSQNRASSRSYGSSVEAISRETTDFVDETIKTSSILELSEDLTKDKVEELLSNHDDDVARFMKMERRSEIDNVGGQVRTHQRKWFPYLDMFKSGSSYLTSSEVIEALDPYIMDVRKERIRKVVKNRSYSVCLVVEGLSDFGNVSAVFRSADALGFQSVHVVSCDSTKRYRDNRHVSMGAEKWLDIEVWDTTKECFNVLKSRGYRIATTHLGNDAVSIYDMDWSCPTAIVVGNENRGISDEALELSDLHCSIPMKGMVDSFNVSVASGILMHHAVCDRTSRLGFHSDLTPEESQILLAEFSLRHSRSAISIAHEFAKQKEGRPMPKL
ncbi:tRNA/rRNA methyltransferase [Macleaya cordata]|uniref:tRNA/rRNA methyltransferase n=1 Tax=Macleaya cordata TaxID=56857 RepID=A0A200PRA1_MACCD|nr:tRNA/rRNA methyltransferase [Macleaya cordata]